MKCSGYIIDTWEKGFVPCSCPVCGGFLVWDEVNPICNKCHTELMVFPEVDEETGEDMDYGKICPISLPHSSSRKARNDKNE